VLSMTHREQSIRLRLSNKPAAAEATAASGTAEIAKAA
jgi:hypothetical protein